MFSVAPVPAGTQAEALEGTLSQTLTDLTVGSSYTVHYESASPTFPFTAGPLSLSVGGTTIQTVTPPVNAYTSYSATFTATSTSEVMQFAAPGHSATLRNVSITGGGGTGATVDGTIEVQVINTGVSIAVQETFVQSATGLVCVSGTLFAPNAVASDFDNVAIQLGNFTAADVGATSYLKVSQNVAALTNPNNPALNIQSGADEGDVIQVGIAATNTQTLRVSNVDVAISSAIAPSIGAEDAIGQVDIALALVLSQAAQLGAVSVRLQADATDNSLTAVNLQSAESSIRDLNVGEAVTDFTQRQMLVQLGTSIVAQSQANADTVLSLFR